MKTATEAVRTYTCTWTAAAVPIKPREFTSVMAFDGYIGELRRLGVTVTYTNPYTAFAALPR